MNTQEFSSETFSIRPYQPSDKEKVIQLLRLNTPKFFAPSEELDLGAYLDNQIEQYFVVEIENSIQGCGGFNLTENGKIARISWDIIHPKSQGRGLGKSLTLFRIQQIHQIKSIQTIVVRTSQHAYQFYTKMGFVLQEVIPNYWAEGFDLYRMEMTHNKTLM